MATLNLSTNGPSISNSYQSIVNAAPPAGAAAQSPTYGQWVVFSVSAPLANAFRQDRVGKESVLKVQSTGEGELVDLIDEFSDGRIQFAFAKVKDPNTALPKAVLIGWCGEGVPERTKGYFTSHLNTVSQTLHGYHVQVTARSDRDLTPESIVQKVSEASGSKYSGGGSIPGTTAPPPPMFSKPAFTPTQSSAGASGFNPLASRSRTNPAKSTDVDEDGWGEDAPPVTRTQLEKVQSSYEPVKVDLHELSTQSREPRDNAISSNSKVSVEDSNVIKGVYQPVGKVDIAALRKQAQQAPVDDRPTPVKGSYEPVGKVDIAAIRARAQPPSGEAASPPKSTPTPSAGYTTDHNAAPRSLPERSAPFSTSERLTTLPKPKVANRFGANAASSGGTKAPKPEGLGGLESKPMPAAPPLGVGRTFADQGGKTPAQLWAEKKARERGSSGSSDTHPAIGAGTKATPMSSQNSGGGDWKSGYGGKSWATVQTTKTGQSSGSVSEQPTGDDEDRDEIAASPAGGVSAMRDKFKHATPIGSANVGFVRSAPSPPALDTSNKPNAGRRIPIPGLPSHDSESAERQEEETPTMPSPPPQPPRSPTPPTPPATSSSPIRVAMPVGRGGHNEAEVGNARGEQLSPPPPMPTHSLAQAVPHEDDLIEEPAGHDPACRVGEAVATSNFDAPATEQAQPGPRAGGKQAVVQYDYEKAEDNELELKEGESVTNIEMVDQNWWMGQNSRGETGLFPSNYVEIVDGGGEAAPQSPKPQAPSPTFETSSAAQGATATAIYDYEAAEDNELSFPEGATVTGVEFPDEDWWSGEFGGKSGLFPANYVELNK